LEAAVVGDITEVVSVVVMGLAGVVAVVVEGIT
jgi:hypothetical protein